MPRPFDVMTQHHKKFWNLCDGDGCMRLSTSFPATAVAWLRMCRGLPGGWHVTVSMYVWFASERTDGDDLELLRAHLDRCHGL